MWNLINKFFSRSRIYLVSEAAGLKNLKLVKQGWIFAGEHQRMLCVGSSDLTTQLSFLHQSMWCKIIQIWKVKITSFIFFQNSCQTHENGEYYNKSRRPGATTCKLANFAEVLQKSCGSPAKVQYCCSKCDTHTNTHTD